MLHAKNLILKCSIFGSWLFYGKVRFAVLQKIVDRNRCSRSLSEEPRTLEKKKEERRIPIASLKTGFMRNYFGDWFCALLDSADQIGEREEKE